MKNQKFPNPEVAVGAIVFNKSGQVLLIRRGKKPALGQWSVPGGKQEAGETLTEACCREVLEETGIEVKLQSIVAVVERITEGFHYLIVDFVAVPFEATPQMPIAASDVTAAEWTPLDRLDNYDLVEGLGEVIVRASQGTINHTGIGLADPYGTGCDFLPPMD
ncbi:MAG: NUDIX hydrolase [Methylococcales bacterium]